MKLSVSTCAFSGLHKTAAEQLEACSKTKFKYIDLSLGFVCDKTDYQKDIDEILLNQEKFGISYTMGHTPYRHNPLLNEESFCVSKSNDFILAGINHLNKTHDIMKQKKKSLLENLEKIYILEKKLINSIETRRRLEDKNQVAILQKIQKKFSNFEKGTIKS